MYIYNRTYLYYNFYNFFIEKIFDILLLLL